MPNPQTSPNYRLLRTIAIAGFTPDVAPTSVAPADTSMLIQDRNSGTYGENCKGSGFYITFDDGAGNFDFSATAIVSVWVRAVVVPDTVSATTTSWALAVSSYATNGSVFFSVPFRGDAYVQVKNITTTYAAGNIKIYGAPILAGEGSAEAVTVTAPTTVEFQPFMMDAFGRLRVSEPFTLVDGKFLYDKNPLVFDEKVTAGGTSSAPGTTSMVNMTVNAAGDRIVRQTRKYAPYQPGKSLLTLMTGVLNTGGKVANSLARIGIFDDVTDKTFAGSAQNGNGFFYEQNGTTLNLVKRSYVTGSQVDTRVAQSAWNVDPMDGTGPSGITLDVSKSQIFFFDFEWLGVGTVRCGVIINGVYYFTHFFQHANLINTMYTQTMTLPVRYEITSSGAGGPFVLKQGCCTIGSEAGFNPRGQFFSADREVRTRQITTATLFPLVSIRLRKEQNRGVIYPKSFDLLATGANDQARFALIYGIANQNPVVLLGSTFAGVSGSACEYDIIASGMSGGYLISSGYFSSNARSVEIALSEDVVASSSIEGQPDIITLAAQAVTGTINVLASITWQEYF